jgi:methyltransferase (TIGR00027 family)
MKEDQPSTTSQRVAVRRAVHQLLDGPKVFDDPLALRMIGERTASVLRVEPARYETSPIAAYLRAFMAARSRIAEDDLDLAVKRGVRQFVILGAGLDTFAYRNPYAPGMLRIFEVDHPATQQFKQARLAEAGISSPADLTFVPLDFEAQTLAEGLELAGHGARRATFFSWLGVAPYLTVESVLATLRFIASAPSGSQVVFDYAVSPALLDETGKRVFEVLPARVAAAGEPWKAFFDPSALVTDLRAMGFGQVKDIGPEEINARYFDGRGDGLRVGSLAHVMSATV